MAEKGSVQLAVSTVIFSLRADPDNDTAALWLPLVRRTRDPDKGLWALPGGPLASDEDLAASASRTLRVTTGLRPSYLEQLYAFGDVKRSRGERVVSIVYWALVNSTEASGAEEGENVRWFQADAVPALAFDHSTIVQYALGRLRGKLSYSRIAHAFLGEVFTLADLREVYQAVLGRSLDPANFRRQIEASGALVPTGEFLTGTRHRPPRLYRYNSSIDAVQHGPSNEQGGLL